MEAKVKESREKFLMTTKELGIAFWKFIKSIGTLLNECYSWVAYIRVKAPRTSLTIELVLFITISFLYMMSCYIDKVHCRDTTMKRLYEMETMYNDSIMKVEAVGYNRGVRDTNLLQNRYRNEEKQVN